MRSHKEILDSINSTHKIGIPSLDMPNLSLKDRLLLEILLDIREALLPTYLQNQSRAMKFDNIEEEKSRPNATFNSPEDDPFYPNTFQPPENTGGF